jgi:hypothetical protein
MRAERTARLVITVSSCRLRSLVTYESLWYKTEIRGQVHHPSRIQSRKWLRYSRYGEARGQQ